nr:LysR family transcriptional regulator [Mesorhizobium ciceri]
MPLRHRFDSRRSDHQLYAGAAVDHAALVCLTLGIAPVCQPIRGACSGNQSGQIFLGRREGLERSPGRPSNVTQPALSRAIKLLEDEFGGALFHHERRQLARWCARPCKKRVRRADHGIIRRRVASLR